jgi:hypothetical protein
MQTTRLYPTLFLFFLPLLSLAQTINQPGPWSVGLRAGLTVSGVNRSAIRSFSGIPISDVKTKFLQTFHAGLLVNRRICGLLSAQTELLYNQYGGEVSGTVSLGTFSTPVQTQVLISAVEVPLLLKAEFGQGRLRSFANAGGFVAYSVRNKVDVNNASVAGLVPDLNNKFVYGAVIGAGLSIGLGTGRVVLEGRYSYSLGDNINLDFGGDKLHYQIGLVSAGYLVSL